MNAVLAVVLANAHVLTMAPAQPRASVVTVVGETIAYVGDDLAAAKKAAGPGAQVIDAGGRTVIPGFDDAHVHFGLSLTLGGDHGVDLPDGDRRAWVKAVARASAARPDGDWLFVTTRRLPDGIARAADLDFVPRPLFVVSARGGIINHRGLKLAGISADEAPGGFVYGRELAAALERVARTLGHDRLLAGAREFLARLGRLGITSVQLIDELPAVFEELRTRGELTARVRMIPLGYRLDTRLYEPAWHAPAPDWVRVDGVKYFHDDGARLTRFELQEIITRNLAAARQVVVHVLSGHALDTLLDGIEQGTRGHAGAARLFRIEHADEVSPDQARRLARLGIVVCSNPSMIPEWRSESAFPMRTLIDAGVRSCIGTDWVGRHQPPRPLAPLDGIALAVTRSGHERINAAEALDAYTVGSAAAEGQQAKKGSLTVGKFADLVVLSADPTTVESLATVEVMLTMVGGQVVYRKDGFGEAVRKPPPATIGPEPARRQPTIGPPRPENRRP